MNSTVLYNKEPVNSHPVDRRVQVQQVRKRQRAEALNVAERARPVRCSPTLAVASTALPASPMFLAARAFAARFGFGVGGD